MNGNDVIAMYDNWYSHTVVCPKCKKPYRQDREDQVPGFRDMDYDYCPYCNNINGKSMTYEYHNYPIDKSEIAN